MTIKNIEDLKKCQIVCRNQDQVKDCLNYLKQLGFSIEATEEEYRSNIVFWENYNQKFITADFIRNNLSIEFYNKKLVKTLQKFIKQKEEKEKIEDFEVASDGRIIKINNLESEQKIYTISGTKTDLYHLCFVNEMISLGLLYATAEARDKANFKLKIENQLKNIAERLNAGRKIDWEKGDQNKYFIYYNYNMKELITFNLKKDFVHWSSSCNQGTIYCLDKNFLNIANQEIGEKNLIKYFTE